ncbi:GAP family protein [Candidatus Micrarchaeota archaeon]|nr:GAP family protein [Candidatus Micrarchaeota archaeon]
MLDLLLKITALGIGSTVSPVIFGITISLLAENKYPRQRTLAFLCGSIVVAVLLAILGSLFGNVPLILGSEFSKQMLYLDIFLGLLFIFFGIYPLILKKRKQHLKIKKEKTSPALIKWFSISFIVNITNFDAVLLYLTEVREIFQSSFSLFDEISLSIFGGLFFILPVLLPFIAYLLMGKNAKKFLNPFGNLMEKYGQILATVIFLLFGFYFIWRVLLVL